MQNMNNAEKALTGSGGVTSLKHFVYLDRERLISYMAQLSDGVTLLRRFLEGDGRKSVETPIEHYGSETQETSTELEGNIGLKAAVGVSSTRSGKKLATKGFKDSGVARTDDSFRLFAEDKAEHDNLYLILEERLTERDWLREITPDIASSSTPRLVKVKGAARFCDWNSFHDFLKNSGSLWPLLDESTRKGFGNKANLKPLTEVLQTFSLGRLTLQMQYAGLMLMSSLNPGYLAITLDQLRAGYIMPGDIEIVIVGLAVGQQKRASTFPGVAGAVDMGAFWETLVGKIDVVIDPIAVYGELSVPHPK